MAQMKIFTKKEKGREDSFWYYDQAIARIGSWLLIANGDIDVTFPDGQRRSGGDAVSYALDQGWKDKDLGKLEWNMNNWFEVLEDGGGDSGEVCYQYDEAIHLLKEAVKDKPVVMRGPPKPKARAKKKLSPESSKESPSTGVQGLR